MNGEYVALMTRIRAALPDLVRVVERTESVLEKAKHTGDDAYLDAVALNLHGFYSGVEQIFVDIARNMEQAVPAGPDWHRELLLQMSAEATPVRPSVITQATRHCLDDYRSFRHVVRNVYTFNLRPSRLQELTAGLRPCFEMVVRDLGDFVRFLEQIANGNE
ncbi:MAG: hypothetical protein AB1791_05325 [Chloroflexota bacterium]